MTVARLLATLLLLGVIMVAFTGAVMTATETVLKDEQEENRRALFDHAGNQLRNWILVMLALLAAIFTVVDKGWKFLKEVIGGNWAMYISVFIASFLIFQCLYSFTRILWYTQFSAAVLYAPERPLKEPEARPGWPPERPWNATPIFLLKESADELTKSELANVSRPCLADWVYWIGGNPVGLKWFEVEAFIIAAYVSLLIFVRRHVRILKCLFLHGKLLREKWVRSPEHDGRAL